MNLFKVTGNPHSKQVASDSYRSYGLHIVWTGFVLLDSGDQRVLNTAARVQALLILVSTHVRTQISGSQTQRGGFINKSRLTRGSRGTFHWSLADVCGAMYETSVGKVARRPQAPLGVYL